MNDRSHAVRAALVSLLVLVPAAAGAAPCAGFTDVDDSSSFCTSVAWMKNRGITLGCTSATLYCPNDAVTRLQMAAFLYRLGFQNAFLQGGNAFGATAVLGTTDFQTLSVRVGNVDALKIEPTGFAPNMVVGNNSCITPGIDKVPTIGAGVRGAVIAGGGSPNAQVNGCGAGDFHKVYDHNGTIAGGFGNTAGSNNGADDAAMAAVGGGVFNSATAYAAGVAAGDGNQATGQYAFVGGGTANVAGGTAAAIPGGSSNTAGGAASLAAGFRAKALGDGSMAFADSTQADLTVMAANAFVVGFAGGIGMYTSKAQTTGCSLPAGGGTWNCSSSQTEKHDVAPVDTDEMLERVVTLPISTWRYRTESSGAVHVGPMAQDFHAAFGLGDSDRSIGLLDASGVALASIQGLNRKLEAALDAKRTKIAALEAELAELRRAVEGLRAR